MNTVVIEGTECLFETRRWLNNMVESHHFISEPGREYAQLTSTSFVDNYTDLSNSIVNDFALMYKLLTVRSANSIPFMPLAVAAINKLKENYRVIIILPSGLVANRLISTMKSRKLFLETYFYIHPTQKYMGNYMTNAVAVFDTSIKDLTRVHNRYKEIHTYLVTKPWNLMEQSNRRVNSWKDFIDTYQEVL